MNRRWTTSLAWSLCGLYLTLAVISQGLLVVNADPTFWESLAIALVWFLFPLVGALIASRQPGTAVGWIFCALGLVTVIGDVSAQYASYALFTAAGSLPAGELMAWLQSWPWSIQFGLLAFLVLLFPNGKLPSRRWRPVAWVTAAASVLLAVGMALTPGPLGNHEIFHVIANPVGIEALAGEVGQALGQVVFGLLGKRRPAPAGAAAVHAGIRASHYCLHVGGGGPIQPRAAVDAGRGRPPFLPAQVPRRTDPGELQRPPTARG